MLRNALILLVLAFVFIIVGCSGGSNPTAPSSDLTNTPQNPSVEAQNSMTYLWGLYNIAVDTESSVVEIIPARGPEFTVNVVQFLQPPQGLIDGIQVALTDMSEFFSEGRMGMEITLIHPFPGLHQFTGFDVMGVFIGEGGPRFYDTWNDLKVTDGIEDAILENADGYTRWMDPVWFADDGSMFTFTPGRLGTPGFPAPEFAAEVHGYKYFTDGLAADESIMGFYSLEENFDWRGKFSPGSTNSREYKIKWPMPSMAPEIKFQYAIVANWDLPDPTLTGDPEILDVPGDFPPGANLREAFHIDFTDNSTTWYVDPPNQGGDISLDLEVFTWHGLESIGRLVISSFGESEYLIPDDYVSYEMSDLTWSPGSWNSSVVTIDIPDVAPSSTANQDVMVSVQLEPYTSYDQGFGSPIQATPIMGYFRHTLKVRDFPPSGDLVPLGQAAIEPYFDGFGPAGTIDDPIPTEWWLTLDASESTGNISDWLWELNGDGLYDDASGEIVSAGFPDTGTHSISLKIIDGLGGEAIFDLPGTYEVVLGTYVWVASPIDFNDGSRGAPWYFVPDGIINAGAGGYVLVRGDNNEGAQCEYIDDVTITDEYSGIRIQGYYGDYDTDKPPMHTGFIKIDGDNVTVDGFEMTGPSGGLFEPYGYYAKIGADQADNALIRHIYIHDLDGNLSGVICWFGGSLLVQNVLETQLNGFRHANKAHEDLDGTGPQLDFLNCTIDRAVETDEADIGIYVSSGGGTDFTPTIRNTIMTDCGNGYGSGPAYFRRQGPFEAWSYYSCTFDTPEAPDGNNYYMGIDFGDGLIEDDPMYVDPYSDHHLQPGSPCEDTGDPEILDADESLSDMGCYGGPYGDWDFEN